MSHAPSRRGVLVGSVALGLALTGASTALAAPQQPSTWTVAEPASARDSGLRAHVTRTDDGKLQLSVQRGATTVLEPSPLGITTTEAKFDSGLTFVSQESRQITEDYATTSGKRREHHSVAQETRLTFRKDEGELIDLLVRVSEDGVAYRYVLPEADGEVAVQAEASAFKVPSSARAWMAPWVDDYEETWSETTVGQAPSGEYGNPALFQVSDKDYLLITESQVIDQYGATRLTLDGNTDTFNVTLPDAEVSASSPMATPWRTMIVGGLDQVVESDLVDDLAPPSRIADTSWIKPGRVAWSWWSDHQSPSDPAIQRKYIDYAAEQGWEYVVFDEGWDASWVPGLVEHARQRGVDILLWSHWTDVDTQAERDELLPLWKSWGVKGLKVDFMESDSQARMHWYDDFLQDTAKHQLMVNFHGSTIPHGIKRTWPHVMTREAVRGAEYYTFDGVPGNTPEHNATLPFARNVIGSMDYTPVTFSAQGRTTSDGHELGQSVVYESGWQHFADSVESYRERPVAAKFLAAVPAAWDDTRFVSGEPGKGQVIARRNGEEWFVGGIFAGPGRPIAVPFSFLPDGEWRLELTHDGPGGLVTETQTVNRESEITVAVPDNGGFAAQLCRADRGTCD